MRGPAAPRATPRPFPAPRRRALLERSGLTPSEAARRAGWGRQNMHRFLCGFPGNPTVATVAEFLRAVGANFSDIDQGDRQMTRSDLAYRALGHAVATFDPDRTKLPPGQIFNLMSTPKGAALVLRNHWPAMRRDPATAAALDAVAWSDFEPNDVSRAYFWIGYYGRAHEDAPGPLGE